MRVLYACACVEVGVLVCARVGACILAGKPIAEVSDDSVDFLKRMHALMADTPGQAFRLLPGHIIRLKQLGVASCFCPFFSRPIC